MPKSKRSKLVALSKVKKRKTTEWKAGIVASVRKFVDKYPRLFVLQYENFRTDKLKSLQEQHRSSCRFYFGPNKVTQIALGRSLSEEYHPGLSQVAANLKGNVGLLFTSLSKEEALNMLSKWEALDFARAGAKATQDFRLQAGRLNGPDGPLPHTIEPRLRTHKLPVRLDRGAVELIADHTVCEVGQTLTPDAAAILKVFGVQMALFKFRALAYWQAKDGSFEQLEEVEVDGSDSALDDLDFGGVDVPELPPGVLLDAAE